MWYDFLLGLLILPGLLACSNWEISGDALLVEKELSMNEFPILSKLSKQEPLILFKGK